MARRILQDRIEEMELGEGARTKVKAREKAKKKASVGKKSRRKYRKLAEEGKGGGEDEEGGEGFLEGEGSADENEGLHREEKKVEVGGESKTVGG